MVTAVLLLGSVSEYATATEDLPVAGEFFIESTPTAAEVYTITGKIGVTPLYVGERDIYPNTFPPEKIDMYGVVRLKKIGCQDYTKRLTLTDIGATLDIKLHCANTDVNPSPEQSLARHSDSDKAADQGIALSDSTPSLASNVDELRAERRLRQLKLLQGLLADGLISIEEESSIRKRILDAL